MDASGSPTVDETKATFAREVAERRRAAGLTQDQLAEWLGLSKESVAAWEQARNFAKVESLLKLCELFSCSP